MPYKDPEVGRAKARERAARRPKRVFTEAQKEANRARAKAWYHANPERSKAANAAWCKANPKRSRAIKDKWLKANPPPKSPRVLLAPVEKKQRRRARQVRWVKENEPRLIEERKAYYEANKKEFRAKGRVYSAAHSKETVARAKRWREENPERYAAHHHTRRVMSGGPVRPETAVAVLRSRICYYCGVGIERAAPQYHPCKATIDHKLPIKRGGTNVDGNLVAACLDCNMRKGRKTEAEFFAYLAEYGKTG